MIKLKKGITFGSVLGETFIFNSETGKALKFDQQGTKIWNLIYKGYSKLEIKEYYEKIFPESRNQICKDINNFFILLEQLLMTIFQIEK